MAVFRVDITPVGSIAPNTIATSTALGFNAKTVLIDNFTAYWLYLPGAFLYIPPFFIGIIAPLEHVANYGEAVYLHPFTPTVAQNPTDTSYFVHFTWTDVVLPPAPGAPLAGNVPSSGLPAADDLVAYATTTISVGITAIPIPSVYTTAPQLRKAVLLQASGNNADTIYIGGSTVTANDTVPTGGIQMPPGSSYPMDLTITATPYAISGTADQRLIVAEAR